MRIIAGSLGGRTIVSPKGDTTRPTSDRVREALFSTLDSRFNAISDACVLDLFAGSGALGLEALSRGAARATFVEADHRASEALRRNITALALTPVTSVDRGDAFRVASCAVSGGPFSLLFVDPPYRIEPVRVRELLEALAGCQNLLAGAVVAYEHRTGVEPEWPAGFEVAGDRVYGETTVSYALWQAEERCSR